MKKKIIIGQIVLIALVLNSCTQTDFNPISTTRLLGDSLIATTTIAQVQAKYMTLKDVYTDTLAKNAGLFTCDLISNDSAAAIINGVVTSSDIEGNIYKYITVQERGVGGMALKISINAGSLSGLYPVGQRVSVRLNGLYIGRYAQSPQVGTHFVNLDKFKVDTLHKINIYRIEPGRIPLPIATELIHPYGLPNPNLIKADTLTIAQIKAAGMTVVNKLVCIKNAYFTGKGADYGVPSTLIKDADYIFAPSTNGIGYPQSREIQDGTGSIFVSTSEYSRFANYKLPDSSNRGNITSIVGWYNDKDNPASASKIYYQLTLRGLFDLGKGFESYHTSVKN